MTTAQDTVRATKGPLVKSISVCMLDPDLRARGEELGLAGFAYYFGGRGGVLGDVDADVVTAAFAFFHPGLVRKMWDRARGVMPPAEATAEYAESCRQWGRRALAGVEGLDRLCELAEGVAAAAELAGRPLFAGWRALPLPDDPPARAAQLLFVLREHRGEGHIMALQACGVSPLHANLSDGGADNARFHGYRDEPYPDPEPVAAAYARAEQLTDTLATPPYEVLSDDERTELVELMGAVKAALTG